MTKKKSSANGNASAPMTAVKEKAVRLQIPRRIRDKINAAFADSGTLGDERNTSKSADPVIEAHKAKMEVLDYINGLLKQIPV